MKAKEYCQKYFSECELTKESAAKLYIEVFDEVKELLSFRKRNPMSAIKEVNEKWNSIAESYNSMYPDAEFGLKRNSIWNDFAADPRLQMKKLPS